jgi:hypothetical protein
MPNPPTQPNPSNVSRYDSSMMSEMPLASYSSENASLTVNEDQDAASAAAVAVTKDVPSPPPSPSTKVEMTSDDLNDATTTTTTTKTLPWGVLDALTGRALLLVPRDDLSKPEQSYQTQSYQTQSYQTQSYQTQSYQTQSYQTQFIVRRGGNRCNGLWLAGSVELNLNLVRRVNAFAYDIPISNAAEFDAASFEFSDPEGSTACLSAIDRARRNNVDRRVIGGLALQQHLLDVQIAAGRLAVSPPDRRPLDGERANVVLLDQVILNSFDNPSPEKLAAVMAVDGEQIVAGLTNRLGMVLCEEPLSATELADAIKQPSIAFLWVSRQLESWLRSGRAARRPSRISPSLFLSLV